MGKNLAHIHSASLTTIWWLSAQVDCEQVGVEMSYFERQLKKLHFNIIIIRMVHAFQRLIPMSFSMNSALCVQVISGTLRP